MTTPSRRKGDQVKPYVESEIVDGYKRCPEAVKERIRDRLAEWQHLLFLNDFWIQTFYIGEDEQATVGGFPDKGNKVASADIDRPYHQIRVSIYPEFWEWNDKDEQEHALVHELCHPITEELYELVVEGQCDRSVTNREREHAREEATDRIASIARALHENVVDERRRRVAELEDLTGIYPRLFALFGKDARAWLEAPHLQLDGAKAVDLLGTRRFSEIVAIVDGLESGAHT